MNLRFRFTVIRLIPVLLAGFNSLVLQTYTIYSQEPQIVNFEKRNYNADRQNWSVDFDSSGMAYFGNNIGLLEFDGITWKLNPTASNFIIRTVKTGNNGIVYTGGYRELGYWKRNDDGKLAYFSLSHLVEDKFTTNEEFWDIIITKDKVCFHTFSGLFVYDSDTFNVVKPGGFVNFACYFNDDIYFTLKDKGIYKLSGNSFEPVVESSFLMNKTIRFILSTDKPGIMLIGTESNGIFLYDSIKNLFTPWLAELNSHFTQNKINRGILMPNGNILIGTILDGCFVLDREGNLLHHLNVEKGLQSNTVLGLTSDSYGNVWLALDKGIDFIAFPASTAYVVKNHKELGALYSAAIYHNTLYIGTNQGLYQREWNDKKTFSLVPNTQEQVWDCKIVDNSLFVGHNFGTFVINNQTIDKISEYSGGFSIVQNPLNPDILIQSTYSNLIVYTRVNNRWTFSHAVQGFNNLIRHLEFDHLNNLWASHLYQGVYKIKLNDQFDSVRTIKYFGKNSILGQYERNSYVFKIENRIIFTTGKLLYTYDDLTDSIVPYQFLNDNLGDYSESFKIVPAEDHRYWFINKKGIACFKIHNNRVEKIKEYPNALFEDKLIQNYENIVPLEKELALVCLENGYAILNTASAEEGDRIISQELQLREVISSDKHDNLYIETLKTKHLNVPFNRNSLIIRYSFPFYSAEKIVYQFKIEGLMDNWSEQLEKPIFNIKRIPPGKYKLLARAVNGWEKSSKISVLEFSIKSPWYQTSYTYVGFAMLFAFLAFYSRRLTIKRVKMREKRKRLMKERELIQLKNEKLQSEITFKSQQLANSTMGIIKKNEFLLSLKENLKKQKESLGTRYPDKYFQNILKKIDNNISGQDDWKIFESNFVQAHETFLKNLKHLYPELTPSDLRLCAYLRINLTTKEIAPLLGVSVRGVENHRYRLRKKLNLSSEDNLIEFILNL